MSKSRGNVVNPDEYISRVGADTLRLYLMFLGPFDQGGDFSDRSMGGVHRFLNRVWDLVLKNRESLHSTEPAKDARQDLHRTIQKVSEDIQSLKYNTAIAALMEYLNVLQSRAVLHEEEVVGLLLMLAPFAPHITEELWARLGKSYSIHQQLFPKADPQLLIRERVPVAVQINGRTRGQLELSPDALQQEALELAMQLPSVQSHIGGASIKRVVYVPSRIINIVV